MDSDFTTSDRWREVWPLFAIEVRTPTLVLRPVNPGDVVPLTDLAVRGIHDPADMPFELNWTDNDPTTIRRNGFQWWTSGWATFAVEAWRLPFVVLLDGEPIGVQDIMTEQFPKRRTCTTGSWLGQAFQGQGHGKEMRAAILHFAFAGLGAQRAETSAWVDNAASLGVTRSLGYASDGTAVKLRRGEPDRQERFALERGAWEARRRDDIEIVGLDRDCLAFLGL